MSDVYTNAKGQLYTFTNDKALIDYPKLHAAMDFILKIDRYNVVSRSMKQQDIPLIKEWLSQNTGYSINESLLTDNQLK